MKQVVLKFDTNLIANYYKVEFGSRKRFRVVADVAKAAPNYRQIDSAATYMPTSFSNASFPSMCVSPLEQWSILILPSHPPRSLTVHNSSSHGRYNLETALPSDSLCDLVGTEFLNCYHNISASGRDKSIGGMHYAKSPHQLLLHSMSLLGSHLTHQIFNVPNKK
ncbi:unnamed protein product [Arabidopsis lyrata]|uniref:Predicted protein n=1 Tax=Arabidopsis lyrata subsp. lyrata TaxID=81972 RepID=D7L097_ARALL|nr:predicted protein [Arabidopsis lyrata subsp. lyrata]CAH8262462.1 unnamed protein product [Arabidopsis lyrata]